MPRIEVAWLSDTVVSGAVTRISQIFSKLVFGLPQPFSSTKVGVIQVLDAWDGAASLMGGCTLQVLTDHTEEVWHIQFSGNGRWLASASQDCTAIVWEVVPGEGLTNRHRLRGHTKELTFCCWRPDDTMLATCSFDGLVKIWCVESGACICTIDLHQGATFTAAWHPDGKSSCLVDHLKVQLKIEWPSTCNSSGAENFWRALSDGLLHGEN